MIEKDDLTPVLLLLDSARMILGDVQNDFFEHWNPEKDLVYIKHDYTRYGSMCYAVDQLLYDMEQTLSKLGLVREWGIRA